ncbi:MAG: biotin/lipoyl-binding protein, partial [Bacteroidetes bacterium]|nr:biotin/lipoyl-binding protein [Bacteroidota bacterium]
MKKLRIYLFAPLMLALLAFTGLFFIAGCAKSEGGKTTESSSDNKLVPVKTALVAQKNMALPIHSSGFLTTTAEQRLAFKIGGIVKKIYVDEGDFVKAGQLLAVLDKTEIDAQLRQAQEGLGKAERDLNRVLALYKDSSATLELVQNATTGRDVAKESAKIAAFNQQYAEIRATRPGKIIKKLINEGEITGPGTPAFVLFETGNNDWVVKINTSDRDWARINLGMPA